MLELVELRSTPGSRPWTGPGSPRQESSSAPRSARPAETEQAATSAGASRSGRCSIVSRQRAASNDASGKPARLPEAAGWIGRAAAHPRRPENLLSTSSIAPLEASAAETEAARLQQMRIRCPCPQPKSGADVPRAASPRRADHHDLADLAGEVFVGGNLAPGPPVPVCADPLRGSTPCGGRSVVLRGHVR